MSATSAAGGLARAPSSTAAGSSSLAALVQTHPLRGIPGEARRFGDEPDFRILNLVRQPPSPARADQWFHCPCRGLSTSWLDSYRDYPSIPSLGLGFPWLSLPSGCCLRATRRPKKTPCKCCRRVNVATPSSQRCRKTSTDPRCDTKEIPSSPTIPPSNGEVAGCCLAVAAPTTVP